MPTLTFRKTTVDAEAGRDVLSLLLDAGAPIQYLCMGGSCGTCRVRVLAGGEHLAPVDDAERHHLRDRAGDHRLACQAICLGSGDVTVAQP